MVVTDAAAGVRDLIPESVVFDRVAHRHMTCYQDFRFHTGVPVGVVFNIEQVTTNGRAKLTADGFGSFAGPGNTYGNGAIYVDVIDLLVFGL
jgi:hypothetical protein